MEKGLGATQNDLAAYKYYLMAAQQGNADAALSVGKDYIVGIRPDVPKDPIEAYAWLSLADALGNEEAAGVRESVIHSVDTHDLTKAQVLFQKYLADYGHTSQAPAQ